MVRSFSNRVKIGPDRTTRLKVENEEYYQARDVYREATGNEQNWLFFFDITVHCVEIDGGRERKSGRFFSFTGQI